MNSDNIKSTGYTLLTKNGLPIITDDRFTALGVEHGFTTRRGGVSTGEFESLNLCFSEERSDSHENVEKNHSILLNAFDTAPENAVRSHQLHTNTTEIADTVGGTGFILPDFAHGVDGLISRTSGQLLIVRMADCLPMLLYDKFTGAIGAVHSGWKGTIQRIGAKTADMMCSIYNSRKSDILVSFGPSVGSCCYEVGEEFRRDFIATHGTELKPAFKKTGGSLRADMRLINRILLEKVGIPSENITVYQPCTCCNAEYFFSYRRQKTQRGTMAAVIKCPKIIKG